MLHNLSFSSSHNFKCYLGKSFLVLRQVAPAQDLVPPRRSSDNLKKVHIYQAPLRKYLVQSQPVKTQLVYLCKLFGVFFNSNLQLISYRISISTLIMKNKTHTKLFSTGEKKLKDSKDGETLCLQPVNSRI